MKTVLKPYYYDEVEKKFKKYLSFTIVGILLLLVSFVCFLIQLRVQSEVLKKQLMFFGLGLDWVTIMCQVSYLLLLTRFSKK